MLTYLFSWIQFVALADFLTAYVWHLGSNVQQMILA